jgi:hypothetical protein
VVFIIIKASMLGGKPSLPFDNHQQGGMGQNFNRSVLLSRILFRISLVEPKQKSKKMSPTDLVEEEEKAEAEVEAEPRSEKEEEILGKASPKDISDTHLLLCNATILYDLSDKMGDPSVPTISYLISTQKFDQAL